MFGVAFPIFVVGLYRDFKFGVQIDHNKFQPIDDKQLLSRKITWSRHMTRFSSSYAAIISGTDKARNFIFCALVGHVNYQPWDDRVPKGTWSRSNDLFKFWEISNNQ